MSVFILRTASPSLPTLRGWTWIILEGGDIGMAKQF